MGQESAGLSRRTFLKRAAVGGTGLAVASGLSAERSRAFAASKGTVTFADVGVGDPGGDWSEFSGPTGWDVKLVAIGNAPSGIRNVLIAGGAAQSSGIVNVSG